MVWTAPRAPSGSGSASRRSWRTTSPTSRPTATRRSASSRSCSTASARSPRRAPISSTGTLRQTGNALDVAIDGPGFFVVIDTERRALHARRHVCASTRSTNSSTSTAVRCSASRRTVRSRCSTGPVEIEQDRRRDAERTDRRHAAHGDRAQRTPSCSAKAKALWVPPATRERHAARRSQRQAGIPRGKQRQLDERARSTWSPSNARTRRSRKPIVEMDHANETVTTQLAKTAVIRLAHRSSNL